MCVCIGEDLFLSGTGQCRRKLESMKQSAFRSDAKTLDFVPSCRFLPLDQKIEFGIFIPRLTSSPKVRCIFGRAIDLSCSIFATSGLSTTEFCVSSLSSDATCDSA